ncbi:MAG TPA: Zn-ribbon domain-containing OB-fold protein [Dehalococcoidia bacterium]|nr:Zn-ribbon domain-containing OB-fold protein [Dehalococcoidia bacterium]
MADNKPYDKPTPVPEHVAVTRPFWEGAKRHELLLPRCKRCDKFHFYPREQCPNCFSQDLEWTKVSGKARLHAYTIVHQAADPSFNDDVPFVHAVVQLYEGPRMVTNIVGIDPHEVKIDMPLEVVFDDVTPQWTLVKFKPTAE